MDRVVLAVHRHNRDAGAPSGFSDDAAGHYQDFLVGEGDRLAVSNSCEHGLQPVGPRRGAEHELDPGMGRYLHQALAAAADMRRA
jgi:hypothetical protein